MWSRLFVTVALATLTAHFLPATLAEANFCGMKDPDPDKTCVSLRLPWQEEPIYFCTEKSSFKYRNQCGSYEMHCPSQWSKEVLLLATPWDCCPISSIPDNCVNAQCPPKPLNRTCEEIPPPENSPWDCCPKYFCDDSGRSNKECHMRQLEPGCITPPKDKTNCIPFHDSYGCCTQYQCDGDGKPGTCPMQMAAMKYSANPPGTIHTMSPMMGQNDTKMMMPTSTSPPTDVQPTKENAGKPNSNSNKMTRHPPIKYGGANAGNGNGGGLHGGSHMAPPPPYPQHSMAPPPPGQGSSYVGTNEKHSYSIAVGYPAQTMPMGHMHIPCVGDFNCPGLMKCCSNDIASYSDNSVLLKNTHPTHGFCMEPVMM